MNRLRTITIAAVIVVLGVVLAWQYIRCTWKSLQIEFANEQTEIFSQMIDQASEAIRRKPPDVKAAVECLNYTYSYYRSGTKQTSGSRLDRIVERSRSLAERQIIEMLRVVTDADFGADAESWIREFDNQAVSDR